mmetsp:Transcript_76011/g.165870  ORF Transcript_76011/g.165870 Transcript_76011/m.165870 type:complete len:228 (-) Transcript_76011:47-730(-)
MTCLPAPPSEANSDMMGKTHLANESPRRYKPHSKHYTLAMKASVTLDHAPCKEEHLSTTASSIIADTSRILGRRRMLNRRAFHPICKILRPWWLSCISGNVCKPTIPAASGSPGQRPISACSNRPALWASPPPPCLRPSPPPSWLLEKAASSSRGASSSVPSPSPSPLPWPCSWPWTFPWPWRGPRQRRLRRTETERTRLASCPLLLLLRLWPWPSPWPWPWPWHQL